MLNYILGPIETTQGVIFVVDSNDRERMDEARSELLRVEKLLQDNKRNGAVILILANKQVNHN